MKPLVLIALLLFISHITAAESWKPDPKDPVFIAQNAYISKFVRIHPALHNEAVIPSGGNGTNTLQFIFKFYTKTKSKTLMEVTYENQKGIWTPVKEVELHTDPTESVK